MKLNTQLCNNIPFSPDYLRLAVVVPLAGAANLYGPQVTAATLRPATVKAWQSYVRLTEARITYEVGSSRGFLVQDFLPPEEAAACRKKIYSEEICVVKMKTLDQVISHLHREQEDGLENLSFSPPQRPHLVRLCALTGKRVTAACNRVSLERLGPGQEPVNSCGAHIQMAVDSSNHGFFGSYRQTSPSPSKTKK